jgi:hypothetical protein
MNQVSSIARLKVTRMVPERLRFQDAVDPVHIEQALTKTARGRTRKPKRNAS